MRGQQGSQHADGDEGGSGEPVPQVVARHEPEVGTPEKHQDQHVGQRERERGRIDAQHREVFAQDDFQVRGGQCKQQFIRSLPCFLGPDAHGQRRYEEEQQVGEHGVQLIEIGQVVQEKLDLPERGGRAEEDEQGDEDVSCGIAEGQAHVAAGDGRNNPPVESAEQSDVHSSASPFVAFEFAAPPFILSPFAVLWLVASPFAVSSPASPAAVSSKRVSSPPASAVAEPFPVNA